jgi:uncharacterized protein YkwD
MLVVRKQNWLLLSAIFGLTLLAACASGPDATTLNGANATQTEISTPIDPILGPKPTLPNAATEVTTPQSTQSETSVTTTTVASTSAPPTNNQGSTLMTGEENQLAQQLLEQINKDRAANGLSAFIWSAPLTQSAMKHNQLMADGCGLNHQCSNEAGLGARISAEGLKWSSVGENIAYTYGSSSKWQGLYSVHMSMLNETPPNDGHRKNYLNAGFHHLGIGILIDKTGKIWLTEDFSN